MNYCCPGCAQCRSDIDDRESIAQAAMRSSSYSALRDVCCCVEGDQIVVFGTVPSFYLKQIAQCLLLQRFGMNHRIENRLEVVIRS
jgi:hypothetical protein